MITVQILINNRVILARSARNMGHTLHDHELYEYHVDDGRVLKHKRKDGAVALAKMLIDGIEEP